MDVCLNNHLPHFSFMSLIMEALCNKAGHYIFILWFLRSFFFSSSPILSHRKLDVYHTRCGLSANLECRSEIEGSVHKGSISRNPNFSGNEFLCFAKFHFVILPTCSGNCILIFTPLESSLNVLSNCVF